MRQSILEALQISQMKVGEKYLLMNGEMVTCKQKDISPGRVLIQFEDGYQTEVNYTQIQFWKAACYC